MANRENENDETQLTSPVSKEIVELAVELLLKVINSKPKDPKPQRLDRNESICLVVRLKMKPNSTGTIPERIRIPHPLFCFDGSQEICLIIGDEEEDLNAEVAENKIKGEGLLVSKVFQFNKLKADCKRFKDRSKVCQSFDLFMAQKAVLPLIPNILWSTFPANKKDLVPVDLTHKQWRGELESACSSAIISFNRSSYVAKVARVSQTNKEIVENVVAVIDRLVSVLPEKWNTISNICLQTSGSLECSLYTSFSNMPVGIKDVETGSQIDQPNKNGEAGIARGLSGEKRIQHAEKTPDTKEKEGKMSVGIEDLETGSQIDQPKMNGEAGIASGLSDEKRIEHAEKTPDTKEKKGKMPVGIEDVETGSQIDQPKMNGEAGIAGGLSGEKRIQHAEKTPDTKEKKAKTGYLNGQDVGGGVPKDVSPTTSALEDVQFVDLQGGVVANSVDASTKRRGSKRSKKGKMPVGIEDVETGSQIDQPKINAEAGIAGGLSGEKRIQHAEKAPDTKEKKAKTGYLIGQDVGGGVPKDDSPTTSALQDVEFVDLQGGVVANSVDASTKKRESKRLKKTPGRAG